MRSVTSSLWRDFRRWLPGVLISVIALFVVFRLARWEELGAAFRAVNASFLVGAALLTLVFLATRALAWRTLLEDKASLTQTFWTINIGYLLNNLFPLRAGEIGRAVLMGQSSRLGTAHVLSTIVIERAFDLAFAAGFLLSTLPLALGMAWAKSVAVITLVVVLAGLALLYSMARFHEKVHGWGEQLGKKWPLFARIVLPQLDSLLNGLRVLVNPGRFLLSLGWIAASWLVAILVYYVMVMSIQPGAPFWWGAFVDSVLAMGIAIPSAPAALGVFEASIVGALTILGITPSAALAYAVIMHFMQFVITGMLGLIGLARVGRSLSSLFSDLSSKRKTV